MNSMRRFATLVALSGLCFAQDKPTTSALVPKDACAVLRVAGPGVWRERFARTQVQKLLLGPTAEPLRAGIEKDFETAMTAVQATGKLDADLLRKLLTDYAGEMVLAVQIDFSGLATAMQQDTPPRLAVVCTLTNDGKTDLAALCAQAEKAAEGSGEALRDLKAGGMTLRLADNDGMQVSLPMLIDGNLVMFAGTELAQQVEAMLANKQEMPAMLREQATLSLHLELAAGIQALLQAVGDAAAQSGAPFDVAKLLQDLGLGALEGFDLSLGADGRYLAVDGSLALNDKSRGLLGLGLVPATGMPALARLLPAGIDNFSVGHVDFGAGYRALAEIWDSLGEQVPMRRADAEAAFAEQCKVRLKEDLLDHLGSEILVLQDLGEALDAQLAAGKEGDEDKAIAAAFAAYCIGLSLQDGKAFAESLEKLIRARGMHAGRKTEDYAGAKVHRLKLFGLVDLEYCVVDDLLLLALGQGEAARHNLRAVLDERQSRAAGNKPPELPATVRERMTLLPEGCTGFGATAISSLLSGVSSAFRSILAGAGAGAEAEGLQQVLEVIGSLQGEMRQLGLDHMLSAQKGEKNAFRFFMRW